MIHGTLLKRHSTRTTTTAPVAAPSTAALQAEALAKFQASLSEIRLADQRRFDTDGLPRYARPVVALGDVPAFAGSAL